MYQLVLFDLAGGQRVLPVAPSAQPFDADLGPDRSGRATLVWSACPAVGPGQDCDLHVLALRGGAVAQPIAGANTGASEYHPTLWRGRLAFVRRRGRATPQILTRALDAPRSRRSRSAPGIPTRVRCQGILEGIGAPRHPKRFCKVFPIEIEELELRDDRLALIANYGVDDVIPIGFGTEQIRIDDLRAGSVRAVAGVIYGEGGQRFLGLSFADGWLGYTRSCFGDPGGCTGSSLIHRYSVRRRLVQTASGPYRALTGFALLGGGRTLQVDPDSRELGSPNSASSLVLTSPLHWTG